MSDLGETSSRVTTFKITQLDLESIKHLAEQGFSATDEFGNIACFYCKLETNWWDGNTHSEHKRLSPNCPRINKPILDTPVLTTKASTTNTWDALIQFATDELTSHRSNVQSVLSSSDSDMSAILSQFDEINAVPQLQSLGINLMSHETLTSSPTDNSQLVFDMTNITNKLPGDTPPQADNVTSSEIIQFPAYPSFKGLWVRMNTFTCWPAALKQTPTILSHAGFFYSQFSDMVSCFSCGGSLKGWHTDCDPWKEHAVWFPNCSYVKLHKGAKFIRLARQQYRSKLLTYEPPEITGEEESNSSTPNNTESCSLCFHGPIEVALIPCGHSVTCAACVFSLNNCPVCRAKFNSVLRIFH